jgi:arginine exporter protein ArgO
MKSFLHSHAGKGTVGVYLAGLLLAWPPTVSWLGAVYLLAFAVRHFREAFRQLDAAEEAAADRREMVTPATANLPAVVAGGGQPALRNGGQG